MFTYCDFVVVNECSHTLSYIIMKNFYINLPLLLLEAKLKGVTSPQAPPFAYKANLATCPLVNFIIQMDFPPHHYVIHECHMDILLAHRHS